MMAPRRVCALWACVAIAQTAVTAGTAPGEQASGGASKPWAAALADQLPDYDGKGCCDFIVLFMGIGSTVAECRQVAETYRRRWGGDQPVIAIPYADTGSPLRDALTAGGTFASGHREQAGVAEVLLEIIARGHRVPAVAFHSAAGIDGNLAVHGLVSLARAFPDSSPKRLVWMCTALHRDTKQLLEANGMVAIEAEVKDVTRPATRPARDLLPRWLADMPLLQGVAAALRARSLGGCLVMLMRSDHGVAEHGLDQPANVQLMGELLQARRRPTYLVTSHGDQVLVSLDRLQHDAGRLAGRLPARQEAGGWVVCAGMPILLRQETEAPDAVAARIRERNDREHAGEQAIVLIDGDPDSEQNRRLIAALERAGYDAGSILVVDHGSLYAADGRLVAAAKGLLPAGVAEDPIQALAFWGLIIGKLTGRPVYGVTEGPRLPSDGSLVLDVVEAKRRGLIDFQCLPTPELTARLRIIRKTDAPFRLYVPVGARLDPPPNVAVQTAGVW